VPARPYLPLRARSLSAEYGGCAAHSPQAEDCFNKISVCVLSRVGVKENDCAGGAVRLGRRLPLRQVEIPDAIVREQQRAEQDREERRAAAAATAAAAAESAAAAAALAVEAAPHQVAPPPPAGDPATCLHGASFYLHATRAHPLGRAALTAQIVAAGGAVAARVGRASHVVCSAEAFAAGGAALDKAAGLGLPVVRREFIEACVAGGVHVPEGPYLLGGAASPLPHPAAVAALDGAADAANATDGGAAGAVAPVADGLSAATAATASAAASKTVTVVVKGRGAVDPDSELAEGYHVLERAGAVYSATLSRTDLATGRNSYYALQVPPAAALPTDPSLAANHTGGALVACDWGFGWGVVCAGGMC
jgi:hypothetical protein